MLEISSCCPCHQVVQYGLQVVMVYLLLLHCLSFHCTVDWYDMDSHPAAHPNTNTPHTQPPLRLQVEAYGLLRFLTLVHNPNSTVKQLMHALEKDIAELYSWKVTVQWIKDHMQNDLNPKHPVSSLLRDMDSIFIFITPIKDQKQENSTQTSKSGT